MSLPAAEATLLPRQSRLRSQFAECALTLAFAQPGNTLLCRSIDAFGVSLAEAGLFP